MLEDYEFRHICDQQQKFELLHTDIKMRQQNFLRLYNEIAAFQETNINAVFHHRISLYGPPCRRCGKPLRTPQAKWCAFCGAKRIT